MGKGAGTSEAFQDVVRSCREKIGGVKAQLELTVFAFIRENEKCFYKYIHMYL